MMTGFNMTPDPTWSYSHSTLELRDYFAACALTAATKTLFGAGESYTPDDVARCAYKIADAMLAKRQKRKDADT